MNTLNNIVVLFGADATVPWGGKIGSELTDEIINLCKFRTNSNKPPHFYPGRIRRANPRSSPDKENCKIVTPQWHTIAYLCKKKYACNLHVLGPDSIYVLS